MDDDIQYGIITSKAFDFIRNPVSSFVPCYLLLRRATHLHTHSQQAGRISTLIPPLLYVLRLLPSLYSSLSLFALASHSLRGKEKRAEVVFGQSKAKETTRNKRRQGTERTKDAQVTDSSEQQYQRGAGNLNLQQQLHGAGRRSGAEGNPAWKGDGGWRQPIDQSIRQSVDVRAKAFLGDLDVRCGRFSDLCDFQRRGGECLAQGEAAGHRRGPHGTLEGQEVQGRGGVGAAGLGWEYDVLSYVQANTEGV